jgi:nucleotide-binding universal stress UspA family protein
MGPGMSFIVVGVDGSPGARAALRFALREAELRGAGVRAVGAWHLPVAAYAGGYGPGDPDLGAELQQVALHNLEQALTDAGAVEIPVETIVREGVPARVLLDEARDAELLVVGSRGLGGFRGLLLGSVSQQCAHHAPCPLVIVPSAREL